MTYVTDVKSFGTLQGSSQSEEKPNTPSEDPFAASDAIVTPESDLVGKFKKSKDAPTDVVAGLSDLTVPTIPLGMLLAFLWLKMIVRDHLYAEVP